MYMIKSSPKTDEVHSSPYISSYFSNDYVSYLNDLDTNPKCCHAK